MVNSISISLSGLEAASKKINASASNIANMQTVGSLEAGGQEPYTPITTINKAVTDLQGNGQGVQAEFAPKKNPFVPAFDADSPFADKDGIIGVPNVNLGEEAVNIMMAEMQFKANMGALRTAKELSDELMRLFDKKV